MRINWPRESGEVNAAMRCGGTRTGLCYIEVDQPPLGSIFDEKPYGLRCISVEGTSLFLFVGFHELRLPLPTA